MTAPTTPDAMTGELLFDMARDQICECRCSRSGEPHDTKPQCDRPATFYVELHDFAMCQHPSQLADPRRTAEGFRSVVMCDRCLLACSRNAERFLKRLPSYAVCPQFPVPNAHGCGRPVSEVEDLIPVRTPL